MNTNMGDRIIRDLIYCRNKEIKIILFFCTIFYTSTNVGIFCSQANEKNHTIYALALN